MYIKKKDEREKKKEEGRNGGREEVDRFHAFPIFSWYIAVTKIPGAPNNKEKHKIGIFEVMISFSLCYALPIKFTFYI